MISLRLVEIYVPWCPVCPEGRSGQVSFEVHMPWQSALSALKLPRLSKFLSSSLAIAKLNMSSCDIENTTQLPVIFIAETPVTCQYEEAGFPYKFF